MRIKDLQVGTLTAEDGIAIDGATYGTRKISKADIRDGLVPYDATINITAEEKATARNNIGAMASNATPTPAHHESTHEIGGDDALPAASTNTAGLVKLYNGVDSDSTTLAATAAAVKATWEHATTSFQILETTEASVTVPDQTRTTVDSLELSAGIWIISAYWNASVSSGKRVDFMLTETNGGSTAFMKNAEISSNGIGEWRQVLTIFANIPAIKTLYLRCYHNDGKSISSSIHGIKAIRIGDAVTA